MERLFAKDMMTKSLVLSKRLRNYLAKSLVEGRNQISIISGMNLEAAS